MKTENTNIPETGVCSGRKKCGLCRRFEDMCLGVKLMLAPGLILIAILFLASITWNTIKSQSASLTYIVEVVFEQQSKGKALRTAFDQADAALTRLLVLALAEAKEERLKEVKRSLDERMASLDKADDGLRSEIRPQDKSYDLFLTAEEKLDKYRKYVKDITGFVEMDATTALGMRINNESIVADAASTLDALDQAQRAMVDDSYKDVNARLKNSISILLVVLIVTFLGAAILSLSLSRALGRRIRNIIDATVQLANGNHSVSVRGGESADEVGQMARALQVLRQNALEMDRLQVEQEAQKKQAESDRRALMLRTADDFEQSVKSVVTTFSSAAKAMQSNAQSMSGIALEASQKAISVAAAAEEASSNVNTVASSAEELNASIGEINRQIADSVKVAASCAEEAERTSEVMHGLNEAAEEIGNIVKLIENISGQVNLLALNATIEASRAGEAGRGFAVVAGEVKNLANQSSNAAKDITRQVEDVQERTWKAVEAIGNITSTIKHINEISTAIAGAVEEQSAAIKEIARNIQQASEGTGEVTHNIADVTRAATETGSASNYVLEAAGQLTDESAKLSDVVDAFIRKVRAG
ncbi:MAG: methyl-accepting chemotaxis protein [Alphaproteobacteria bacterium]|nr:methyl-accepting chemotaxis protein [Alphaproteobacteria bacterium]